MEPARLTVGREARRLGTWQERADPLATPTPRKPQGPDSLLDRVLFQSKYFLPSSFIQTKLISPLKSPRSRESYKPVAAFLIAGLELCLGTPVPWKSLISGLVFGSGIREAGCWLGGPAGGECRLGHRGWFPRGSPFCMGPETPAPGQI